MTDYTTYLPDIITVAAIIIFTIAGFKRGLIRSVVRLLSLAASVVLSWMLWPLAAGMLESIGVKSFLTESLSESIGTKLSGAYGTAETLPRMLNEAVESGQAKVAESLAAAAATLAVNVIAFIVVLVVSWLIIKLGIKLLNLMSKLPVIGLFNRAAGAALGAFEGIALVCIVLAVIYAAAPFKNAANIESAIETSIITGHIYRNNPIISILNFKTNRNGE